MTAKPADKIAQLEKQLQALQAEKKALLKIVSHDLRSPLNKIYALVGLIKMSDDNLTEEQLDYLDKIELIINDGLARMHNLMDLRSLEEQRFVVNKEPLAAGRLLKKALAEQMAQAKRKQISLAYEGPDPVVQTDRLLFLRVVWQLLSNAIKFSPPGSKVVIKLTEQDDEIRIEVVDGGYGIRKDEVGRLFGKFSVLSSKPTAGESTNGLGLYLATNMARLLGGKIIYPEAEKPVFVFVLPKN